MSNILTHGGVALANVGRSSSNALQSLLHAFVIKILSPILGRWPNKMSNERSPEITKFVGEREDEFLFVLCRRIRLDEDSAEYGLERSLVVVLLSPPNAPPTARVPLLDYLWCTGMTQIPQRDTNVDIPSTTTCGGRR